MTKAVDKGVIMEFEHISVVGECSLTIFYLEFALRVRGAISQKQSDFFKARRWHLDRNGMTKKHLLVTYIPSGSIESCSDNIARKKDGQFD